MISQKLFACQYNENKKGHYFLLFMRSCILLRKTASKCHTNNKKRKQSQGLFSSFMVGVTG